MVADRVMPDGEFQHAAEHDATALAMCALVSGARARRHNTCCGNPTAQTSAPHHRCDVPRGLTELLSCIEAQRGPHLPARPPNRIS